MTHKHTPYTKTVIFASELIAKTFTEAVRHIFKDMNLGINKEEFIILESIYLNPGIIQLDIAKSIVMKRSYVCKFLGELEEKGYITRKNTIKGKRQVIIKNYITPEGQNVYEKAQKFINEMKRKMSDKDICEIDKFTELAFALAVKIQKIYNLKF